MPEGRPFFGRLSSWHYTFAPMHDPSLHLFVDDHHIRNAICLKRVFFPLEQNHQAVVTDTEGRYIGWGCAMRDGDKYRLWYHSVARTAPDLTKSGVYGKGAEF